MKTILYVLFILFCLSSCDCWIMCEGRVRDAETNEPLDSVLVRSFTDGNSTNEMTTDTSGIFEASTRNLGNCRGHELSVFFQKDGYEEVRLVRPDAHTDVLMQRIP